MLPYISGICYKTETYRSRSNTTQCPHYALITFSVKTQTHNGVPSCKAPNRSLAQTRPATDSNHRVRIAHIILPGPYGLMAKLDLDKMGCKSRWCEI